MTTLDHLSRIRDLLTCIPREQHRDLEQFRALLGHARIDTTQIYTSIRPPQLKRAASFYEDQAMRMLITETNGEGDRSRTTIQSRMRTAEPRV